MENWFKVEKVVEVRSFTVPLFVNVGAKFVQMGQKGKNAFYECALDSNLTSNSAVVVSIFPRKVRIIAPYFTSRLAADIGKYGNQ